MRSALSVLGPDNFDSVVASLVSLLIGGSHLVRNSVVAHSTMGFAADTALLRGLIETTSVLLAPWVMGL